MLFLDYVWINFYSLFIRRDQGHFNLVYDFCCSYYFFEIMYIIVEIHDDVSLYSANILVYDM